MTTALHDAVVVGSGPNGLAAAIRLANNGLSVVVLEASPEIGGGTRTRDLTEPGFAHDVCSAVMPLAEHSTAFASMPLAEHGLRWFYSDIEVAHPLDNGEAAFLRRSVELTAAALGSDSDRYKAVFGPWANNADDIFRFVMGPILRIPDHPIKTARFGLSALLSASRFASRFSETRTRALFGGIAAHSVQPLSGPASAAAGIVLATAAHAYRWAIPEGGSHSVTTAMASYFRSLGGTIVTDHRIRNRKDLPPARLTMLSSTPTALASIFGLPEPAWHYGPGVFKMDWALDGPIPWTNSEVGRAATVHLGGDLEEVAAAEASVHRSSHPDRPFVILAQPTNIDPSRAPSGKHVAWAYCHVPNGSEFDMADRIESQIERFAPGFLDLIIAKDAKGPAWYEAYNENYVGGDIGAGAFGARQLLARPKLSLNPYSTPIDGVFLCGASTAPGAGVHGMCGWWAANAALKSIGIKAQS